MEGKITSSFCRPVIVREAAFGVLKGIFIVVTNNTKIKCCKYLPYLQGKEET